MVELVRQVHPNAHKGGKLIDRFVRLIEFFLPDPWPTTDTVLIRCQAFVAAHLLAPLIGWFFAFAVAWHNEGFSPAYAVLIPVALSTAFWAYPPLLKHTGRIRLLGQFSLLHWLGLLLVATHETGTIVSPLLPWFVAVPLLVNFYIVAKESLATLAVTLLALAGYGAALWLGWLAPDAGPPHNHLAAMVLSLVLLSLFLYLLCRWYFRLYRVLAEKLRDEVNERRKANDSLVAAQQAAQAANLAKSRFLAGMSHDLRTPLNAVIGYSEMIRENVLDGNIERYREYADSIHACGQRLLELVDGILDLEKISSGRVELDESAVDLGQLINGVIDLTSKQAKDKSVSLIGLSIPRPVTLVADKVALRRVLTNLVSNAIKHTDDGGWVSVGLSWPKSGGLAIEVSDNGSGIEPDEQNRILEPFEQVRLYRTPSDGFGLGLPIAKSLVELHGGKLTIDSAPGEGTTVRFSLPADRIVLSEEYPCAAAAC